MDYLYKEINLFQLLLLKYENNKQLQTTMHTKLVRMFQKRFYHLRQKESKVASILRNKCE